MLVLAVTLHNIPEGMAVGVVYAGWLSGNTYITVTGALALSIGIGACGNAAILYFMLRKRGIYQPQSGWKVFFLKVGAALVLLAGVSMWIAARFDWIALQAHPLARMGALALVMIVCGIVYFGALFAMGFRIRDFRRIAS